MIYVGIDPGLSGAIAVIDSDTKDISFVDTPVLEIRVGKKLKHQQDAYAIASLLRALSSGKDVMVTIEKVNAMPDVGTGAKMGSTSAFNFGLGFGMWLGILAALEIPHQQVHPATWKAVMMRDSTKDKDASRMKAMQLFPLSAKDLTRKKDHGRADALLMAAWAIRVSAKPLGVF
jgi:Holliday junction resolvasome RuvABC endonuclease subunit